MSKVLFVCSFGGAKSVVAAAYFNRLAAESSLPLEGTAVSAETPYDAVLPAAVELLQREGSDVRDFKPRQAGEDDLRNAAHIVSIGCDLDVSGLPVERWDDVPQFSENPERSAEAIRRHVEELVQELREKRRG